MKMLENMNITDDTEDGTEEETEGETEEETTEDEEQSNKKYPLSGVFFIIS